VGRLTVGWAYGGLAALIVRFRMPVALFWVTVTVASALLLPSLGGEVNGDNTLFLSSGSPSARAAALAAPILGSAASQSQVGIVAARPGHRLTAADQTAISREIRLAAGVPGVISARQSGTSADGQAALITVRIRAGKQDVAAQQPIVDAIAATFARNRVPPGLRVRLAGQVATNIANQGSSASAMTTIGMLSVLLIIVLLLVVLRSPLAALITLVPSVLALLISMRFIAALGAHGLQISSVTQVLLIILVLGAGTDYGLFLVFRFREELRAGHEPRAAVSRAVTRVGVSITASAGTVVLALLTLLFASFGLYRDLAVPLALGIAVMLLAGLTLLPALLAIAGRAVFPADHAGAGDNPAGLWGRVAARLIRRPGRTLGAGVVVFLGLAAAVLGYRAAGLGGATTAPPGSAAAAGNALVARHFPQSSTDPASLVFRYAKPIWADPQPVATGYAVLRSSGQFTALSGPLNPNGTQLTPASYARLHVLLGNPGSLPPAEPAGLRVSRGSYDAFRASAGLVSADGRTIEFQAGLTAGPEQSTAAADATPGIRAAVSRAAARSGAMTSGLSSQAAGYYDVSSTSGRDMLRIVPIAALVIAVLLGLVLRSLVAPLYLIVSVALSYLAALGLTTLIVIDVAGQDGLIFLLPFLMFIFLLALGEDYNILMMTRIREEASRLPLRQAVVQAVERTGHTITSAGLILAGTFAVFAVAGGNMMGGELKAMGLGLALGILVDTFGVRTLLVPSIVVLLGRWNWWPSAVRPAAGRAGDTAGEPGVRSDLTGRIT
jgi:RND superfamily putative drug exporter